MTIKVLSLDFETALTDGTPSVDYYRPDFQVLSAAFAYRKENGPLKNMFCLGHEAIEAQLRAIPKGCIVIVHNYQFEYGVLKHCFPGLEHLITHDTMRLAQVGDNGGRQMAYQPKVESYDELLDSVGASNPSPSSTSSNVGLGLVACAKRWLPEVYHDHKIPYYTWLREHKGVKKGQEGANLTLLPEDLFKAYNVADAEITLFLYETLTEEFADIGYDYTTDHELYKSTARMVAEAKGVGVKVDIEALVKYASEITDELAAIETQFRSRFLIQITDIETRVRKWYVEGVKTLKAQEKRRLKDISPFNLSSQKQLKTLFCEVLGIIPTFYTKEPKNTTGKPRKKEFIPQPSFKSAHLSTYGEGGEMLRTRRKRLLVLQQTQALIKLAQQDGRWHADMRAAGTATGRLAGGRT